MKKYLIALISFCFVLCCFLPVWSDTTLKPTINQNMKIKPLKKGTAKTPELNFQSLRVSTKVVQGKKIQILSMVIKNGGTVTAKGNHSNVKGADAGYTILISLSGRQLIEIKNTPDIHPGQTREFIFHNKIAVPSNITPGAYQLTLVVDPHNRIREVKENNNTARKKMIVHSSTMPDLTLSAAGSPTAIAGKYISEFSVTTRNNGNAVAPGVAPNQPGDQVKGYFVSLYLVSLDQQQASPKLLRIYTTTSDLYPGQTTNYPLNKGFRIPADTPPGNYQIRVAVDPARKVTESNEANNVVLHNIQVNTEVPAELSISISSITSVVEPGQKLSTCNLIITNTGEKIAYGHNQGFSVALLLSPTPNVPSNIPTQENSTNYSDGMALHINRYPANLPPHQSQTHQLNNRIRIPNDTPAGQYYIIAVVDPENNVNEINESNNSAVGLISVRVPPKPDLAVTSFLLSGDAAFEVTIRNLGPGTIEESSYYVSSKVAAQYYLDNQPKKGFSLGSIDPDRVLKTPGGTVTKTFGTSLNCTASPGSHVMEFRIDPNNGLEEANETNNRMLINKTCP